MRCEIMSNYHDTVKMLQNSLRWQKLSKKEYWRNYTIITLKESTRKARFVHKIRRIVYGIYRKAIEQHTPLRSASNWAKQRQKPVGCWLKFLSSILRLQSARATVLPTSKELMQAENQLWEMTIWLNAKCFRNMWCTEPSKKQEITTRVATYKYC